MTIVEQAPVTVAGTEPVAQRTCGEVWAVTIRAEELGIGFGQLLDSFGLRCTRGAVGDYRSWDGKFDFGDIGAADAMGLAYWVKYGSSLTDDTDTFEGTPLERREFMARRVEVLE